jgi:hypothetical protein
MSDSGAQGKKEQRLKLLEDHIGQALADAQKSGELQSAKSYGKPLDLGDGYDETPAELRMAFKMLKDSGFVPPEVELMREIEALRTSLPDSSGDDNAAQQAARARLIELRQQLALRLEKLRGSGSL